MTDPRENGAEATNGGGDVDDIDDALPDDVSAAADFDDAPDVDDSTDAEDEVEPVELLVQLAEEGEIEPWDIDIVAVTDAFLERLDATDLRTSGRALFYASVLLRMKGDELLSPDEADEEPELEPWEMAMRGDDPAFDDDGDTATNGFDPVDALEAEMDRRLERKRARGSPETLDELVRELRDAERGTWWKESREYDTTNSPKGFRRGTQTLDYHSADDFRRDGEPGEADVTGTTHDEDIEATIEQVEATLATHYGEGRAEVLFAEIRDAGGRAFQTFLALLFLAHRGQIRLEQDELFGDLWVQDPTAVESSDEETDESEEDEVEAIAD